MTGIWPDGFARIPDDDWAHRPLEELALEYDTVEDHGWYRNLDRTVRDAGFVQPGQVVLDDSAALASSRRGCRRRSPVATSAS